MAENEPEQFLLQYKSPVIIDEAQYAPKLFRHLKYVIDQSRELKGQYLLTGSQKFNLMKEVSDSLAGRCVWLELEGLSIKEIQTGEELNAKDLTQLIKLMTRGSQPELWKDSLMNESEYYRSYLATYLERDVRQILNISSLRDFERFIRVCATYNAQILNKSNIAKAIGVSVNTVNQWLSILEASNQISLLEPYFKNAGKRLVKSPKLYFNEVGMISFLLGLNKENIIKSPSLGAMWETFIYSELRKYVKNESRNSILWFYRDSQLREIDFLIEKDNKMHFIEAKWTQTPQPKDVKWLHKIHSEFEEKNNHLPFILGSKILLSRQASSFKKGSVNYVNIETLFQNLS